jgi:hypothetical protein
MEPGRELEGAILTLESWTLDPAVRSSAELMGDLLADIFIEGDASGQIYTRAEVP